MLTVDPIQRITIPEIRKNSWFSRDIPEYLLPLPEIQESITFDDSIIEEISIVIIYTFLNI